MQKPDNTNSTRSPQDQKGGSGKKTKKLTPEQQRIKELESENERLQKENEILRIHRRIKKKDWYPLETGCVLAGIGKKLMEHIKAKYVGKGIYRRGYSYGCWGKDLIEIFMKECEEWKLKSK